MPFEISKTQLGIFIVVAALVVIVAIPLVTTGGDKAKRDEVPLNVDLIRQAEIDYKDAFEDYISATSAPRDPLTVDEKAVPWAPSKGFKALSWAPEMSEVYGSYSVNAKADGFIVNGVCDVDGDGSQARYQATLKETSHSLTEDSIY